jgi:hypothetical protein
MVPENTNGPARSGKILFVPSWVEAERVVGGSGHSVVASKFVDDPIEGHTTE